MISCQHIKLSLFALKITFTHTYTHKYTPSWQRHSLMALSSPARQSAQPRFKKRSGTGLQLTINFIIDPSANHFLTVQSIRALKIVETAHHSCPALNVINVKLHSSTKNNTKPQYFSFTNWNDKEKQQMLTLKKLEPAFFYIYLYMKNVYKD